MSDLPRWDETARPRRGPDARYDDPSPQERARGDHLRMIHDMYRQGLEQASQVVGQVLTGQAAPGAAAEALRQTGMRQALGIAGSLCGRICQGVSVHHRIEDAHLYPALRASDDAGLGAVLDRLTEEHEVIEGALERVEDTLAALADDPGRLADLSTEFDHLSDLLTSHFAYEEEQLCTPLGVHRVLV